MNDLCIQNGRVITPQGERNADIGIKDGRITEIGEPDSVASVETIDATGLLVLPGMVDSHVHIRGGAMGHREDFVSGTKAAAAGGITTLLEMPVVAPPASTPEVFRARCEEVKAGAVMNVALYGGAGADNLEQIPKLAALGAVGFKTFLMPPPAGREAEFFGLCAESSAALLRVMAAVKSTGKTLAVHAEDNTVVAPYTEAQRAAGQDGLAAWERGRPKEAELAAIRRVVAAAEQTGCRVVVCHISTPEGLGLVKDARQRGVDIHAESCPSYLTLDTERATKAGVFARIKPPLRAPEVRRELVKCLQAGDIEIIGSDHAPYLAAEKLKNGDSIWTTVDGMPGLELSLLQMLELVDGGRFTYTRLAQVCAANAAALYGLEAKGSIVPGKDADLVLVRRCNAPWRLDTQQMRTRAKDAALPFEGLAFSHRIEEVLVGGKTPKQNLAHLLLV